MLIDGVSAQTIQQSQIGNMRYISLSGSRDDEELNEGNRR